eukprot:15435096-Alexandrium_andersonii.AAC.1
MHEPPFGKQEHAWGSETHGVIVCGGHTTNAYSGQRSQTIVSHIRSNVYGWSVGGPAENLEFIGGANLGYFEWMQGLIDW